MTEKVSIQLIYKIGTNLAFHWTRSKLTKIAFGWSRSKFVKIAFRWSRSKFGKIGSGPMKLDLHKISFTTNFTQQI